MCSLNYNSHQVSLPDKSDVTECGRRRDCGQENEKRRKEREREREREREKEIATEGGSICIREHSGVNQGSGSLGS